MAIEQLQPAGKKPMSVADFLNGQKLIIGQLFTAQAG
jgi:methionyl-tRNA formyltransferase